MKFMKNQDNTYYNTFSDLEKSKFRLWLLDTLKSHTVYVTFKKADDSLREMKCTLSESIIPKVEGKENSELCTVWDIEKNAWRSFKFEKIIKISLNLDIPTD
jgi:hypothetical protein